jgi:Protein of unknown function (DUF3738)
VPVADRSVLLNTLRARLSEHFAYKTRIQKVKDTVFVLSRIGPPDSSVARSPTSSEKGGRKNWGRFEDRNVAPGAAMAEYLEAFGIIRKPMLNETDDRTPYDISFKWEPEKKGAVDEFLKKLGLKMDKAIREYEVLIIYK